MLSDICYDVLNYNLDGCVVSTKRLGKTTPSSDKPRRLLVVLKSELTVSDLLARARWLRDASDRYIAENVFINKDMTPDEERKAYERRLARRAAPQPRTTADATPSRDNSGAHAGRVIQRLHGQQWRDREFSSCKQQQPREQSSPCKLPSRRAQPRTPS